MLLLAAAHAADTSFVVAGYGETGASVGVEAGDIRFDGVGIAPVLLWRQGPRVLIETEVALNVGEEGLAIDLEYAALDLDVGPIVTAGLFLTPVGQFISRQHPAWINRMPNFPLPYRVGPLPVNHLGFQVQHAVRFGDFRLTGLAFVDNGPTGTLEDGPSPKVTLVDENLDKGLGGRLGVVWIPEVELGGSVYTGAYGADHDRYLLWIVDGSWTHGGWLDVRGEYIQAGWTGGQFNGAWAQAAWRIQQVSFLRRVEPVVRLSAAWGDTVEGATGHSHAADGGEILLDDPSYELCGGVNYYLLPSVVVKLAFTHSVETWDPRIGLQLGWGM